MQSMCTYSASDSLFMDIIGLLYSFIPDIHPPGTQRPRPRASSKHPPTPSNKAPEMDPATPGGYAVHRIYCAAQTQASPVIDIPPTPAPPVRPNKGDLHLGFRLSLSSGPTCIELARMDVVPVGTRGGLATHWWSAAPLVPPDPHTRPQT